MGKEDLIAADLMGDGFKRTVTHDPVANIFVVRIDPTDLPRFQRAVDKVIGYPSNTEVRNTSEECQVETDDRCVAASISRVPPSRLA